MSVNTYSQRSQATDLVEEILEKPKDLDYRDFRNYATMNFRLPMELKEKTKKFVLSYNFNRKKSEQIMISDIVRLGLELFLSNYSPSDLNISPQKEKSKEGPSRW